MDARQEIADFVVRADLASTRSCIIAWIVASFVFSLGAACPYNRFFNALLDFLRDVSEPYLRIFRRLGLRIGPIDFSPIVAICRPPHRRRHHRRPDRSVSRGGAILRAAVRGGGRAGARPGDEGDRARLDRPRRAGRRAPRRRPRQHAQHAASRSACSAAAARCVAIVAAARARRRCWRSSPPTCDRPARVAADRAADRRRGREPDRPRGRGVGDRLRRPPAVAGVQRRRHGDHDRRDHAALRPRGTAEPWS